MNTILEERLLSVQLARQAAGFALAERSARLNELAQLKGKSIPSRHQAKRGKTSARQARAEAIQPASMMLAKYPRGHKFLTYHDERTAKLFRAHRNRQAAGWVRG